MMKSCLHIYLLILFCFASHCSFAQIVNIGEQADSLLNSYASRYENTRLHLHVDKTIYTRNETIWFSAYLFSKTPDTFNHRLLYVKLVRNDNDSVIRSHIFPFQNKHAYGDILLPTAIATGDYKLIAYTDKLVNNAPSVVFRQLIQIKTEAQPAFAIGIRTLDSLAAHDDSLRILIQGMDANSMPLINTSSQYEIIAGTKRIAKGSFALNHNGEAELVIPRAPNKSLQFKGTFQTKNEKASVQLPVYQPASKPLVAFYPEGGSIIQNTSANIAVEVAGSGGEPVVCALEIYENGKLINTVYTNSNGWGLIKLTAIPGNTYEARIKDADTTYVYKLPEAKREGISLQVRDGVVADSLHIVLQKNSAPLSANVIIHDFKTVYWGASVTAQGDIAPVNISTASIPTGLYAITILDNRLQPLAERLIFIHHDQQALSIKTDKPAYGNREKVFLNIALQDTIKNTKQVQLSVSCTDMSRIDLTNHPNILTSFFIRDELNLASENTLYFLGSQKQALNEILMTKGWRNYSWTAALKPDSTAKRVSTLHPGAGRILSKREKPPFELILLSGTGAHFHTTDSTGHFVLPIEHMITSFEKQLLLSPVQGKKKTLSVVMDSAFININTKIASYPLPESILKVKPTTFSNKDVLPSSYGYKVLSEVTVQAKKPYPRFVSKTCNDWVCQYNILNCENHPAGSSPIDGEVYLYRSQRGMEAERVVYMGCNKVNALGPRDFVVINKISTGKEFYKPIYDSSTTDPEFLTTLYWNPLLPIKDNQFEDFFYTSDTKGTVLCIVEGIIDGKPVRAQSKFTVGKD